MLDPKEAYELAKIEYNLEEVRVKLLRDIPKLEFGDITIPPSSSNSEIKVPRFVAKVLEKEGYGEILEQKIQLSDLRRALFSESIERDLQPLDPLTYQKIADAIQEYAVKDKREIEDFRAIFMRLINSRLSKIIKLLVVFEIPSEIIDRMTVEERVLFKTLNSMIKMWRDEAGRLVGLGSS